MVASANFTEISVTQSDRVRIFNENSQGLSIQFDLTDLDLKFQNQDVNTSSNGSTITKDHPNIEGTPVRPSLSRWVVIPDGKKIIANISSNQYQSSSVNASSAQNVYPENQVLIGNTVRMRHIQMAQVTVYPVHFDLENNQYIESSSLQLDLTFIDDNNAPRNIHSDFERIPSPGFQRMIESIVVNPPPRRDDPELILARGYNEHYLFVLPDNIEEGRDAIRAMVYRLMEWKRLAGNRVDLMILEDGQEREFEEVKGRIQEFYDELIDAGIEPFDNILLFGEEKADTLREDAETLVINTPVHEFEQEFTGHWDLWYSYLEGDEDDIVPDVALSRFHAGNAAMMANGINKTLSYESAPYMEDPSWFNKAAVELEPLVNADGSEVFTVEYFKQALEHNGKDVSDNFGDLNGSRQFLADQFASRIGFIAGRAQNERITYPIWMPQNLFDSVNVFPIAIFTSGHGEMAMKSLFWVGREYYANPENYDSLDGAKGVVAATCTWGRPTTIANNSISMGMVHSMLDLKLSYGWARLWSLLSYASIFPDHPDEFLRYSINFQTSGDPGIRQWDGVPKILNVEHPDQIAAGATFIPIVVADPENDEPVENLLVTLYRGDIENIDVFKIAITNRNGECSFLVDSDDEESLSIGITGKDIYPYLGTVSRFDARIFVQGNLGNIDDEEEGNGDGIVNPGEVVNLTLIADNLGTDDTATNVTATLNSNSTYLSIPEMELDFGNIGIGESVEREISIGIESNCPDAEIQRIFINFSADNGDWESAFDLDPQGVNLEVESIEGGFLIDFGESDINLNLKNSGRIDFLGLPGILLSDSWELSVIQIGSGVEEIAVGETGSLVTPFRVATNEGAIPGTLVPMTMILVPDGGNLEDAFHIVKFQLQIGIAGEGDPTGPDEYGYYAFDNTDEGYVQTPDYRWVEISPYDGDRDLEGEPVPITNGNGVNGWGEVELPFTFRYYGEEFNSIIVCTNGFIAMGLDPNAVPNPSNWPLDNGGTGCPYGLIAPLWDNLRLVEGGGIFTVYDEEDGIDQFIIEWYDLRYGGNNDDNFDPTFQIILRNQETWETETGDGPILFQYRDINQFPDNGFASVGITSPDGTMSLAYSFGNRYNETSAPLANRRAIHFTTTPHILNSAPKLERTIPLTTGINSLYPNPFNSTATISFDLEKMGFVRISVFDLNGREIEVISNGKMASGSHLLNWVAKGQSSGLYFIKLKTDFEVSWRKALLVK